MKQESKACSLRQLISYLQVASLWVLLAALPFRMGVFQRWAMIVAGVLFVTDYMVNKRWKGWKWERNKWLYVALIAYYLFIPLWQIGSETYDQRRFFYILETHLPLLLGGIIGIMGLSEAIQLRHIAYVMLMTCLFSSFYIIFRSEGMAFFAHLPHEQAEIFTLSRIQWVSSHMVYNLYLNTSLVFALYLFQQKDIKRSIKICIIVVCAWIFYLLCLTEGRIGLFTTLLIGATVLLTYTYKLKSNWFIPLIIGYIIVGALIMSQHKRFNSGFTEREPRWGIWQASIDIIKEKPFTGYGVCDGKESFTAKALIGEGASQEYFKHKIDDSNRHRLPHPHNAFLQAWIDFGIIGLVTLLFIFVFPLTMQPKKHRIYIFMIVGCFVIQSMTDLFFTLLPLLYILAILFFTSGKVCHATEIVNGDNTVHTTI